MKKHYKELLKRNDLIDTPPEEVLNLYDFKDDCFNLGEQISIEVGETVFEGLVIGYYRFSDAIGYALQHENNETIYLLYKNNEYTLSSINDFVENIIKTCRYFQFKSKTSQKICLFILVIALIVIIPISFKNNGYVEPLIEFENSLIGGSYEPNEIYKRNKDSIILIQTYSPDGELLSASSGIIISKDGMIISCAHIYDDIYNAKFKIILNNGKSYQAIFISGDVESDSCLLKIIGTTDKFNPVTFADSSKIEHGDIAYIMGFPGGVSIDPIISSGLISAPEVRHSNASGYQNSYIQTDAAANPGSSGGALLDAKGRVIGMITSKLTINNYESTIYSVPSTQLKDVINKLYFTGVITRPTLGITFTETTPFDLDNGLPFGEKVVSVKETSGAYGLLFENEIICAVNEKTLSYTYELFDALQKITEDNPAILLKVYNPDTKEYRDITFNVYFRTSNDGYIRQAPNINDEVDNDVIEDSTPVEPEE
jgi:S1-C subfamily serine protease